jgi:hypothetical protein
MIGGLRGADIKPRTRNTAHGYPEFGDPAELSSL